VSYFCFYSKECGGERKQIQEIGNHFFKVLSNIDASVLTLKVSALKKIAAHTVPIKTKANNCTY
jgi:hypothetical protein